MTILEKQYGIIRGFLGNLVRSGLPPDDDSLELYQIQRLNLTIIALVLFVPFFATSYVYLGVPQVAIGTLITGLLAVFCFFWFRKTKNIILAANFILLIYALLVSFSAVYLGGINSSSLWWNTHLPILAVLLLNVRWAAFWTIAVISEISFFIFLTLSDLLPVSPLYGGALVYHDSATKIVAIMLLFAFGILFILEKAKTIEVLERANTQLDQHAEELARLYRASSALVSSSRTNLNSLSQAIVEVVLGEFGQSHCNLLLVDPDTHELICIAAAGPFAAEASLEKLTIDGPGLVPLALRSGEVVNIPNVRSNPNYVLGWEAASSEMAVPLKIGERMIGAIDIQSDKPAAFGLDDERLMASFAERAALALERQRATDELQKFSRVVQQTADIVVVTDPGGVIEYVNPAFEVLTGYTLAEAKGQTPRVVKSGMHDEAFYQKMWRTILEGNNFRSEMTNRKKNGELIQVNHTITPLKNPQGEITHFVSTSKDITERVQAEDAQRVSEERYRLLFNSLPYGGEVINTKGEILNCSLRTASMLGYEVSELTGKHITELLDSDSAKVFHKTWPKLLNGKTAFAEIRMIHKNGTKLNILRAANPILDKNGKVKAILALNVDISERKQAEAQIHEHNTLMGHLAEISVGLSKSSTLESVGVAIGNGVQTLIGADRAALYYRISDEEIACPWFYNLSEVFIEKVMVFVGKLLVARRREVFEPILLDDIRSRPHDDIYRRMLEREGINAYCLWPLIYEGQVIAAVSCSFDTPHAWTEAEKEVMAAFARQASIALQNARLFEEAQRRLKNLQALHTIDVAISGSVDLSITLDILLKQVIAQLNVDAASVLLYDSNKQTLEFAAQWGFRTIALQHTRLQLGESHAGQVALENKIIQISDMTIGHTGFLRSPLMIDEEFIAYLGVPLTAQGKIQGVLEIFHRSSLVPDPEWMELVETLSTQAAIAIDNATLFHDLKRSNVELFQAYDTTLEGWAKALELRDKETEGHTRRVTALTKRLAGEMGMGDEEMIHVHRGALLHDIGKMGIPDSILLNPGKLTKGEWEIMRQHPVYAYNFISQIDYLRPAVDIPYCHHEKWDGTGYPRGLNGEQIPLSARIFAVIDVWDALTSDRPYRKAWKESKVLDYIRDQAGTHFDPHVVEMFLEMLRKEEETTTLMDKL